jgi:hypothetical protein
VSIALYARRVSCDVCGAEEPCLGEVTPADVHSDGPVPDGWVALGLISVMPVWRFDFRDTMGRPVQHLCGVCAALPFGKLVRKLAEPYEMKLAERYERTGSI